MDLATSFSAQTAAAPARKPHRLRRAARWVVIPGVIAAAAIIAWSLLTKPLSVTAVPASRGSIADVVYATGFVEPRRPVAISSRVTAPVTAVLVEEGDRVARGQALATMDGEDQRQALAQLTASRINAEQNERRSLMLFRQGWVTKAAEDSAVAEANSARALESAGRAKLDQYTIRAGISGVVLRKDVEPGDLATASKTLFEIGDPKQLRITATVDERDIPLVRTGSGVMMSSQAYPNRVFRGTVYEITPGGDPDQRAFRVRIEPDDRSLPIGLTLEVNIMVSERQNALLVPATAIHGSAVWIVEQGKARRLPVKTGIRGSDRTEVAGGLSDRACVISDPPADLKDGQRVSAKAC